MWQRQREMLVGTIRCQHWCSDCCGLAERERVWQGKCASYLSEKCCLCSKLSVWSHSNFVCLSTLNLSSRRILSRRRLAQAESIRNLLSALSRGALHLPGRRASGGCSPVVRAVQQRVLCRGTRELPRCAVTKTCKLVSSYSSSSLAGWC